MAAELPMFNSLLTSYPLGFTLLGDFKQPIQPSQFEILLNYCDREMHELANVYTTHVEKTKLSEQGGDFYSE